MLINLKILAKNQNSLKKFLIFFKNFCVRKQKKEILYLIKKKEPKKSKIFLQLYNNFKVYKYKNIYKYKIKKRKYNKKKNVNGFLNYIQKLQKQKVFVILKSPHVNKTAQEQIEYRLFSKQIIIISFQILKFLMLIKRIQTKIYSDIEIRIKFILNYTRTKKTKLTLLNPDNYKMKKFLLQRKKDLINKQKAQKLNKNQTMYYLKLFDIYGELNNNTMIYV
jgi:ribosomal protein S10